MSGWVEYYTSMRSKAKNDFEKDFWKLMVNAVSMFLKQGFYHLHGSYIFLTMLVFQKHSVLIYFQVYGKTIENVLDRDITKICRTKEQFLQHVTRTNYKQHIIINDELVIVFLKQTYVYFNKPFYIGFSILKISKTLMTDFWYLVLKKYYGKDVTCLYSHTDSFIIKVS